MDRTHIKITQDTARKLAVLKQGLHERSGLTVKRAILNTVRRIGLVQMDAINVVARSHYLVLLSRLGLYNSNDLDEIVYSDRLLFEQWAHAACLIPSEDYPYFAPAIASRRDIPLRERKLNALGSDPEATMKFVLAQVRERGALSSSDFEDGEGRRRSWWDRKPAKIALDILYDRGYLMVSKRTNFRIYYDLPERVLATLSFAGDDALAVEDWTRWSTLRSLRCLGVGTLGDISDYYRQNKAGIRRTVEELVADGSVRCAEVDGWREPAFTTPEDLLLLREIEAGMHEPTLTTFLSPFDNLIWERQRVQRLFDFTYKVEIYTPAIERKSGYYVMPILHRGHLVGRLDPKVDRQNGILIIHNIRLESGVPVSKDLLYELARALREFMSFHDCSTCTIENSFPKSLKGALVKQVR